MPARPTSTATQHDPSGFAGPTTAATRRRKPDVQRIASRRVRRANVLKIDVFRGLRPLPRHPRVRRASAIVRHRPDRVRVYTRTRSPSPRSSISPGRAFTACRRCSDKARDSFVGGDWCSASKPVDPIHVPVRPPACRSRHRQRWSPPRRRRCLDWAAPRGRRRPVVMHLLRPFTPPTCRSRSRVARGVGRAAAPPAPSSFSTAISNGWKNIRRSNSSEVDSSRQNALIHNLPSCKNRNKADFGLRIDVSP